MKAIAINEFGGRDKLKLMDLPMPEVGRNHILIQVKAAGVNPVDWKIREGMLKHRLPHEFPVVLGWDAAGVVAKVGADVEQFSEGREVYASARRLTCVFKHVGCVDQQHTIHFYRKSLF